MDLWDSDKLWLFVLFVVPGFISLKFHELVSPGARRPAADQLIDAVAYSCLNYGLLLWPIWSIESAGWRTTYPQAYLAFYAFVLLLAPSCWTALLIWLRRTQFVQRSLPHPTLKPWDYVFSQRRRQWVIVTLKDGSKIAGRYADRSFASSLPAREQLYLEETWVLDEKDSFKHARAQTAGILILAEDMVTVELFDAHPAPTPGVRHDQFPGQSREGGKGLPAGTPAVAPRTHP